MNDFNLNKTLIEFSANGKEVLWTLGDAVQGVQIFGGTGSGKTSGSGRMLALKYLSAGFGGLVLTVKPDEKETWENYCALVGREKDLIIVEPQGSHFFDFMKYESKGETENIVQVLKTVIRASEEQGGGRSDDSFWETALDMLVFNVIDLCRLAYGSISVQLMYDVVQTLPRSGYPNNHGDKDSAFNKAFLRARENVNNAVEQYKDGQGGEGDIAEARTLKLLDQFFFETFLNLSEKTRSIIDFSFSGFLFRLLRDPVYSLFCSEASTFAPEDCLKGKIIIINLPVKLYHKIGRDCQIMFKYIWQRAMEKRDVKENDRPLFLWADEAQNFIHEHDTEYQATARSSRIATVYITQNLANYHANMGGIKSEFRVKSFLGTLGTKIFHANADVETNRYASDLIGDGYFEDITKGSTIAGQFSTSRSRSLKIDRIVRPEDFTTLKTGGTKNNYQVEGYIQIQGNPVGHIKVCFDQNYNANQ